MMRTIVATLTLAVIALILPATAPAATEHAGAKHATSAFMREAAQGGMAEVQLGKLAAERAESPDVRQFGQRMVDNHSKANDELKQLAQKEHVDLPKDIGAEHKALLDRLSKLSGAAFDKAYMHEMVTDHVHDVALFEREAKQTRDPELKAWIETTLPTLKEHQQVAHETASKVGGTMHGKVGGEASGTTASHSRGRMHQGNASR